MVCAGQGGGNGRPLDLSRCTNTLFVLFLSDIAYPRIKTCPCFSPRTVIPTDYFHMSIAFQCLSPLQFSYHGVSLTFSFFLRFTNIFFPRQIFPHGTTSAAILLAVTGPIHMQWYQFLAWISITMSCSCLLFLSWSVLQTHRFSQSSEIPASQWACWTFHDISRFLIESLLSSKVFLVFLHIVYSNTLRLLITSLSCSESRVDIAPAR